MPMQSVWSNFSIYEIAILILGILPVAAIIVGYFARRKVSDRVGVGSFLMGGGTGTLAVSAITWIFYSLTETVFTSWYPLVIVLVILTMLMPLVLIAGTLAWLVYLTWVLDRARFGTFLAGVGLGGSAASFLLLQIYIFRII